jgi:hypothetical protein
MSFAEVLRFFNWDKFVQKLSESASNPKRFEYIINVPQFCQQLFTNSFIDFDSF